MGKGRAEWSVGGATDAAEGTPDGLELDRLVRHVKKGPLLGGDPSFY